MNIVEANIVFIAIQFEIRELPQLLCLLIIFIAFFKCTIFQILMNCLFKTFLVTITEFVYVGNFIPSLLQIFIFFLCSMFLKRKRKKIIEHDIFLLF